MEVHEIQEALERALPYIAVDIQNALKIKAPVDTGRLRNSIKVQVVEGGLEIFIVDYALFLEFGTNRMRPHPFIRPTFLQKLPGIIKKRIEEQIGA